MTTEPQTQVVRREAALSERLSIDEVTKMKGIASALAQAGVFRDAQSGPVVFAKIVIGRELGLNIGQSMTGIHLVEGSIQMHYSTMLSCVRAHGYDYRVREHTEELCTIEWGRGQAPGKDAEGNWIFWPNAVGETTYRMEDAEAAGIFTTGQDGTRRTPRGKDSNYQKVPKNMLLARAVSNGTKEYVPEALGGMPVYVPGEIPSAERFVNGSVQEESPAEQTTLSAALADVPEPLRQRLYDAYGEAAHLRPGALSPAAIQMSVGGQSLERIEAYARSVEAANDRARQDRAEPADAEVVPETSPSPVETTSEAGSSSPRPGAAETPPDQASPSRAPVIPKRAPSIPTDGEAEGQPDVEALRRELSDLYDQQADVQENPGDETETNAELERIAALIDDAEAKLLSAGADVPGQEPLL